MSWKRGSDYHLAHPSGATICKVSVLGKWLYELWVDRRCVWRGASADAAKQAHKGREGR